MAYKFQQGTAKMSGSLLQEEGITVAANGVTATLGAISGSANFECGGDFDMDGAFTVLGASSLQSLDSQVTTVTSLAATLTVSGSGNADFGGALGLDGNAEFRKNVKLPGTNEVAPILIDTNAQSGYILYATGSQATAKKTKITDFVTSLAGTGITYNSGTGKLDSDSAASPTEIKDANATLVEGLNYATGSCTIARTWQLPNDPTAGDTIHVKAYRNVQTDSKALTVSKGHADSRIDDNLQSVELESDSAAITLVCAIGGQATARWKII
jgi:hypothetical protein